MPTSSTRSAVSICREEVLVCSPVCSRLVTMASTYAEDETSAFNPDIKRFCRFDVTLSVDTMEAKKGFS